MGVPPGFDRDPVISGWGGIITICGEPAEGVDECGLANAGATDYGEVKVSRDVPEFLLGITELLFGGPEGWAEVVAIGHVGLEISADRLLKPWAESCGVEGGGGRWGLGEDDKVFGSTVVGKRKVRETLV